MTDIPVSLRATVVQMADNTSPLFSIRIGDWQNNCLLVLSVVITLDINTLYDF